MKLLGTKIQDFPRLGEDRIEIALLPGFWFFVQLIVEVIWPISPIVRVLSVTVANPNQGIRYTGNFDGYHIFF
jgi:hypothetical protein